MLALLLLLGGSAVSAKPAAGGSAEGLLARGNALYFRGEFTKALESYEGAARAEPTKVAALLNGAVVLEELGRPQKAAAWFRRAAALSPQAPILAALGWAGLRSGELGEAATSFQKALARDPHLAHAWLGLARVELASSHPRQALSDLGRAEAEAPLGNLPAYYRGRAYEMLGDNAQAAAAYRQAVIADSYFTEGRDALARVHLRRGSYNEAWRQVSRILEAEPRSRRYWTMLQHVQRLLVHKPPDARSSQRRPIAWVPEGEAGGGLVPRLRVGVGTNPLGKPRAREFVSFKVTSNFSIVDAASGQRLAAGRAGEAWAARLVRVQKKRLVSVFDAARKVVAVRAMVIVRPAASEAGVIAIDDVPDPVAGPGVLNAARILRGELEIAAIGKTLRLVNTLDLENYTHGVVSAEMPIQSPLEALKAQAVVARSHALFIKQVTRRHRRDGFDVCDEQHCQVYAGIRAESRRSREIVNATRGEIVTYRGKVAHVIYSSNCGGYTQSGKDLRGWGDVPYWTGVADGNDLPARPASPWELRTWLRSSPPAYCRPSSYVHPSHFRWARLIAWQDLEEKLNRKLRVGKLKTVRTLKRSPAGNVRSLAVEGSRRRVVVDEEMAIRGLLGVGSLRSTLFAMETDYGPNGRPETLVLTGGGWGHGVGLCQSGAMGRAEAGQTYAEIIKAYFKGTELRRLDY